MEANDLLFLLTQAGGVDEGVWYQLQRIHDLHKDTHHNQHPTAASSSSSSSSSSSRDSDSNDHLMRSLSCSTELDTTFDEAHLLQSQSSTASDKDNGKCHKTGQESAATTRTASRKEKSLELRALSTALSDGSDTVHYCGSSSSGRNARCTANSMNEAVSAADCLMSKNLTRCLNSPSDQFGCAVMKESLGADSAAAYTSCTVSEGGISLGKRLVRYADVWDEEDFIFKSNQESNLSALYDWSTLVKSYSDTHDGMYRDWNIQHLRKLSCAAKKDMKTMKKSTQNHKIYPDTETISKINSEGFDIRAPPVPVSMIHPSCWSINARKIAQETCDKVTSNKLVTDSDSGLNMGKFHKVFDIIHPASLSNIVVEVPGTAAERDGLSDIDDFTLHTEIMMREIQALEASNYMRLKTLSSTLITASKIEQIRKKRIRLTDALTLLYQRNEYENLTSEQLTYGTVPAPLWALPKALNCPDTSTAYAAYSSTSTDSNTNTSSSSSKSNIVDVMKRMQCDSESPREADSSTRESTFTITKQTR